MYIHCSFLHFWNKSFKTNYWIRNYRPNPNWPDLNVSFNVQSWTNRAPLQTPEALVLGNISAGKDVNDSIWVHFLLVNNTTMSKRLKEGLGLNTSFHTQTERKWIYHLRKPGANFLWKVPSAKANQRRCGSLGSKSLVKNTHILRKKKEKKKTIPIFYILTCCSFSGRLCSLRRWYSCNFTSVYDVRTSAVLLWHNHHGGRLVQAESKNSVPDE